MATRLIVVDDSDPLVKYSGEGWFPQDTGSQDGVITAFGRPFLHTLHGTKSNDSFSISFQGSSIQVFGTNDRVDMGAGTFDPSWECFVDKISIGANDPSTTQANNWPFCGHEQLIDGPHELTVNVIQHTASGRTFSFDYIRYTPSASVSEDLAYVYVENQDPGIAYGPGWVPLGNSASSTTKIGTELTFNFIGKGLSWFSYILSDMSHNSTSATYSIDGGDPVTFALTGLPPDATSPVYNQLFFSTPELSAGPHSLHVVHGGDDSQTPLGLDYLILTNTSTPIASNSSTTSASTPTASNPSTTSTPTPAASNPSTPSTAPTIQSSSTSSRPHIAATVGGFIGGTVAILVLLLVYKRSQRQRVQLTDDSAPSQPEMSSLMTARDSSPELPSHTMQNASASQSSYPSAADSHPVLLDASSSMTNESGALINHGRESARTGRVRPVSVVHDDARPVSIVHEDSGRRFQQEENVLVEVPPGYSEI